MAFKVTGTIRIPANSRLIMGREGGPVIAPVYTIANASTVSEGGTLSYTVSRTEGGVAQDVSYTVGGTATLGTDYETPAQIASYLNTSDVGTSTFAPIISNVGSVALEIKPTDQFRRGTARAFGGKITGKWYYEAYINGFDGSIGLATKAVNLNDNTNLQTGLAVVGFANGAILVNGATVEASNTNTPHDKYVCVAFDADNEKFWVGVGMSGGARTWLGSGTQDPATGQGGYSFAFGGVAVYPYFGPYWAVAGQTVVTANFGQSSFNFSVPTGFVAWTQSAASGVLSFGMTDTSKVLSIPTWADLVIDGSETVTVTLDSVTGTGTIGNAAVGTGTITDTTPTSVYTIANATSVSEGSPLVFTVSRTPGTGLAETVSYSVGGTATSGVDYTAPSGTVSFGANTSNTTITINTATDTIIEGTETVTVTLTSASVTGTIGSPATAIGSILDATSAPVYTIANATTVNEGSALSFLVSRTSTGTAENVTYTLGGTATSGVDYTAPSGILSFSSSDASKSISITTLTDSINEGTETLTVTLTGTSGTGSIGSPATGSGSITDTTSVPSYSVAVSPASTTEGGSNLVFTITRATTGWAQNVAYSFSGTATYGTDYTVSPTGNVAVFASGDLTSNVTVTALTDALIEGNETLSLTLNSVTGTGSGSIGSPSVANATIIEGTSYNEYNSSDKGTGTFAPVLTSVSGYVLSCKPSAGSQRGVVRAFGGKTTGKWYFEVKTTGTDGNLGLCTGSVSLNQDLSGKTGAFQIVIFNGQIYANTTLVATGTAPQGRTTAFAYDADAGKVWVGIGNNNGTSFSWVSGNPATGTGGYSWTPGAAVYPTVSPYWSGSQTECLANFGQSTYTFTKPSGFNDWVK